MENKKKGGNHPAKHTKEILAELGYRSEDFEAFGGKPRMAFKQEET